MKTTEIRQRFLDYFAQREHAVVDSSPLVPNNDPSLLFTNSGMVQFKDVFLGNQARVAPRAVTAQRCLRAGGKHNDLENVGYTARHHTFFEMLGNFSFGDYFKQDAIQFAWQLLTEEFGLPRDKLWITVFEQDDEAAQIWTEQIGIPPERVTRIGAKDNFWQMGDTGPCGPCSEIFYDHGAAVAGGPPGSADQDGDRYVEIWNLVFMQFNRSADGTLTPLPKPSVDTGMGLERIAAVLQGVHNNYDIDLFQNLVHAAAQVVGAPGENVADKSLRVLADHIRSSAFLIVDGVLPANDGRGYVLRRIIRRAIRHGYRLGCKQAFMHRLVAPLVAEMGQAYPLLQQQQAQIARVLEQENERFNQTLEQGLKLLEHEIAQLHGSEIPGAVVFKLYDTFGFPADLTADVAREKSLSIDQPGFAAAMAQQQHRARAASQFAAVTALPLDGLPPTDFSGYTELSDNVTVLAVFAEQHAVESLSAGQDGVLVLQQTPFYAESGGQVGDRGKITFSEAVFEVQDTRYLAPQIIGHCGTLKLGRINAGDRGRAEVAATERQHAATNHSATHLLHAALRAVLGEHVQQKGSLVTPQRLRFDFSHATPLSAAELRAIAEHVNAAIRANAAVSVETMPLQQAKAAGAAALFGEKYAAEVRTIKMGQASFELCGGTHVQRTGDIGNFVLVAESGVAAGVRRIEALSGTAATAYTIEQLAHLRQLAAQLHTTAEQLPHKIQTLVSRQKQQQRELQNLQAELATTARRAATDQVKQVAGVKLVTLRLDDTDAKTLRRSVDQWKQKLGSGIVLVAGQRAAKVSLVAGVTADLTARFSADELIRKLAALVDGQGGGKAELAQGGGSNVQGIDAALEASVQWVQQQAEANG